MRPIHVVLPFALSCLLAACGGGGSSPAPATPSLQSQTIVFSQIGTVSWRLTGGTLTNVASGGAGSGAITYQSSNPAVATVNSTTGAVTPVAVGTTQITATKAADATYQSATASYILSILESISVPFTAAIGAQDAQVSFPAAAQGLEFLRSTQADCNVAQFTSCADHRVDALATPTLLDATTNLSNDAIWWLRDGARVSAATRISNQRFKARARMTLASFQGKLLAIGGQQSDIAVANDIWATEDGVTWRQLTSNAGFGVRSRPAVVTLNDRLWLIAGEGAGPYVRDIWRNDVWSSADGVRWQLAVNEAAFPGRIFHAAVEFNGRLWVVGGSRVGEIWQDVWWSTDGVQWTAATVSAPFGQRLGHTLTVFNGRMWLIGGNTSPGTVDSDVWSTADGVAWRLETANAGFPNRWKHGAAALNGQLWVFGGESDTGALRDVWSSTDGVNWVEVNPEAAFPARQLAAGTVHNGRLWFGGGELIPARSLPGTLWLVNTDDVWSSANGIDWTQMTPYSPFFPGRHNVAALNGKLWVVGGSDLTDLRNEVWSSEDGATWVASNPSNVFSARGDAAVTSFDQQLWLIGGVSGPDASPTLLADVWRSTNGAAWSQVTSAAAFGGRQGHRVVVFNDRLLLVGGRDASGHRNDVWTSTDGSNWNQIAAAASFAPRAGMELAVHDGRVWLVGGSDATTMFTDAWSSVDGITWQLATANVPHLPFDGIALTAHGGRLWLTGGMRHSFLGGYGSLDFSNAVWSSVDGASWTREPDGLFTGRTGAKLVSSGGLLWLIGGQDRYGPKNDVWSSVDGTNWRVRYSGRMERP